MKKRITFQTQLNKNTKVFKYHEDKTGYQHCKANYGIMIKAMKAMCNFRKLTNGINYCCFVTQTLLLFYLIKGSQFEHNLYLCLNEFSYFGIFTFQIIIC